MESRHTRVYRITSSQFELMRGIMPSLWAIYSSGNTDVFISISTMSIAGTSVSVKLRFEKDDINKPTVGISAMTTLRRELANLG